jgi:DNA-binding protein YbaB
MTANSQELQRWVNRLQRKLDSMLLTKYDREELEELVAIIVNFAMRQVTQAKVEEIEAGTRKRRNGGES